MCAAQRWPAAEWRALFLAHPLAKGTGHRLVFQALDASGAAGALFRVAEDDALVDHAGATVVLAEGALVRLAHPAELTEDARAHWKAALEAAGVTAPFPQLDRAVVVPSDGAEPFGALLTTPVPARSLARLLDTLNYRAGDVIDGGSVVDATRSLGPGASIRLSHSGFAVQRSGIGADEQCTIERVELEVGGRSVDTSEAPRGLLNEALLDLRRIVAAADG
jgi:hypothetical protein